MAYNGNQRASSARLAGVIFLPVGLVQRRPEGTRTRHDASQETARRRKAISFFGFPRKDSDARALPKTTGCALPFRRSPQLSLRCVPCVRAR